MVSFDVKSLFTNVPLEKTIEITLERTSDRKEIKTQITRPEMKELLILCTKNVHFMFDNQVYQQNDGMAMGSPLLPVLNWMVFMILNWKRFVDDTLVMLRMVALIQYYQNLIVSIPTYNLLTK